MYSMDNPLVNDCTCSSEETCLQDFVVILTVYVIFHTHFSSLNNLILPYEIQVEDFTGYVPYDLPDTCLSLPPYTLSYTFITDDTHSYYNIPGSALLCGYRFEYVIDIVMYCNI